MRNQFGCLDRASNFQTGEWVDWCGENLSNMGASNTTLC